MPDFLTLGDLNVRGKTVLVRADLNTPVQNGNGHSNGNGRKSGPASDKQVKYLIDLAAQYGTDLGACLRKYGVAEAKDLSRDACSKLIDEIGGKKK